MSAKPRSAALLNLDKAERAAALNFQHCWIVLSNTGAMSDQLKLFAACNAWNEIYFRMQEMERAT